MAFRCGSLIQIILIILLGGSLTSCGGGGGSSPFTSAEAIALTKVTFSEGIDPSKGSTVPPGLVPLSQQIVFHFTGPPALDPSAESILIYALPGNEYSGPLAALDSTKDIIPARGTLTASGNLAVFNPAIPVGPIDLGPDAEIASIPGLLPGFEYQINVPVGSQGSIYNLKNIAPSVPQPLTFVTGEIENLFFGNFPLSPPEVSSISPQDGTTDFPVELLNGTSLPGPFEGVEIQFDMPLESSPENLLGEDVTKDGHPDSNFFFRSVGRKLWAALSDSTKSVLVRVDIQTGEIEEMGEFGGGSREVLDLAYSPHGTLTGLTSLFTLVTVDPLSGALTDEVDIQIPSGGSPPKGLCYAPDNTLFCLDTNAPLKLMRLDRSTGAVLEEHGVGLPPGKMLKDLFFRWDGALMGILAPDPPSGPSSELVLIEPDTGALTFLGETFSNTFESGAFTGSPVLLLFDKELEALRSFDLHENTSLDIIYLDWPEEIGLLELAPLLFDLGAKVELISNDWDKSVLMVKPAGILPFGEKVELLVRHTLKNIRGWSVHDHVGVSPAGCKKAATFETYDPGSGVIDDFFLEDFDDFEFREKQPSSLIPPASWNVQDADGIPPHLEHLVASRGSVGTGELGDLNPHPLVQFVFLNTDHQPLPLNNGSTPDIKKPVVVKGGVFHFRKITIPEGVTLVARGSNPLVLNATESVVIEGTINVSGDNGTEDVTFDSAFVPCAGGLGGPGGGRGGMGQPPIPEDFKALTQLQSVPAGESGYDHSGTLHRGGRGGESGSKGYDLKWQGFDPESRGAGGGGGQFNSIYLAKYTADNSRGQDGKGFWGVDPETGQFILRDHEAYGGSPGNPVFSDGDPNNDYLGPVGELGGYIGGQGGGGGGSKLESMHPDAKTAAAQFTNPAIAPSAFDAKGGGGGGGGGTVVIRCLGPITVGTYSQILARGGKGGGGEMVGEGDRGGGGGGGSGGAIVMESGEHIWLQGNGAQGALLDVRGGRGNDNKVTGIVPGPDPPELCDGWKKSWQWCCISPGDGGLGGFGIIQLMVPDPETDLTIDAGVFYSALVMIPSTQKFSKWGHPKMEFVWDPDCLLDPQTTPSQISAFSCATSKFIDLGAAVRRPSIEGLAPPLFMAFEGIDVKGMVITQNGWVKNSHIPGLNDIEVDAPDMGLKNYIPEEHNEVRVEFQGADAAAPGSGVPDPDTLTDWSPDPAIADGMRFLRFRIHFDITKGAQLTSSSYRPQVNFFRIRMRY